MEHIRSDAIGKCIHIYFFTLSKSDDVWFYFLTSSYELLGSFVLFELYLTTELTLRK